MTDQRSILIARYLDGSAAPAELAEVDRALRTDPQFAIDLLSASSQDLALHDAMGAIDAPDAVDLSRDASPDRRIAPMQRPAAMETSRMKIGLPVWYAAAACLLVAAGVIWFTVGRGNGGNPSQFVVNDPPKPGPVATIRIVGPGAWIDRSGSARPASVDTALSQNDILRTGSEAGLTFQYATEETNVTVGPMSAIAVASRNGSKRIELSRGYVECDVAKQQPGHPMVVATNAAEVRVVGTHYRVATSDDVTRVEVSHGTVRVTRLHDGAAVDVSAGEFVDVLPTANVATTRSTFATTPGRNMGDFWSTKLKPIGIDQ